MKKQQIKTAGKLGNFLGHSITSSIRAMGKAGWTFEQVRAAMAEQGLKPADQTIRIQLSAGRKGKQSPAAIPAKELASLRPKTETAKA